MGEVFGVFYFNQKRKLNIEHTVCHTEPTRF